MLAITQDAHDGWLKPSLFWGTARHVTLSGAWDQMDFGGAIFLIHIKH